MRKAKYKASRDYGTRSSVREKHAIRFGGRRGTLYRRGDSESRNWQFRIYIREERINVRKTLRTDDLNEAIKLAEKELLGILHRVDGGQRIGSITLFEAIRGFQLKLDADLKANTISVQTRKLRNTQIRRVSEYLEDRLANGLNTKVSDIDGSNDFSGYLEWRVGMKEDIRRTTVKDELQGFRLVLKQSVKQKFCTERAYPIVDFKLERGARRARIQSLNDYTLVLAAMRAWASKEKSEVDKYYATLMRHVFLVMAHCGARTGELFSLKNKHIKRIDREKKEIDLSFEETKTRSDRSCTIFSSFSGREDGTDVNYLIRWIDEHQLHKGRDDYIFSSFMYGESTGSDGYYTRYGRFREYLKKKGGEYERLAYWDTYHCRHYFITRAIESGSSLAVIGAACGNSERVIASTYSHLLGTRASAVIHSGRAKSGAERLAARAAKSAEVDH